MRESFSKSQVNQMLTNNVNFSFPREDEDSPRQAILAKFCEADLGAFRACMTANNFDENKCGPTKAVLDKCSSGAFKSVNADVNYVF